jgi:hypothetical protein
MKFKVLVLPIRTSLLAEMAIFYINHLTLINPKNEVNYGTSI